MRAAECKEERIPFRPALPVKVGRVDKFANLTQVVHCEAAACPGYQREQRLATHSMASRTERGSSSWELESQAPARSMGR